jgi:hypothetical protein
VNATDLQPNDPGHDLGQPTPVPPGADQVALSPAPTTTTQLPADAGREPLAPAPAVDTQVALVDVQPTTTLAEPTAAPELAQGFLGDAVATVAAVEPPQAILPATGGDTWAVLLLGVGVILAGAYSQVKARAMLRTADQLPQG